MVHASLVRPLSSASSLSSFCHSSAALFSQPRPHSRPALIGVAASGGRVIRSAAATPAAEPGRKKPTRRRSSIENQHSTFSTSTSSTSPSEVTDFTQQATHSEAAANTKTVRSDRRFARKAKDAQSRGGGHHTDLRLVHGVGPKNEQLLLKIGLSSVESLKEVFRLKHKESTLALKQYLQEKVGIRSHHCSVIATDIKQKVDDETEKAGGPSTSRAARRVTLCVEGNISAGKSTFLNWVAQGHPELANMLEVVPEPVDKWQDIGDGHHNVLKAFYETPERFAYTFQNYVFVTRMMQERETQLGKRPFRLLERSVFSDRMVFVRAVHEAQWMSDLELNIYDSWFEPVVQASPSLIPDGFIYLRATPDICMNRLKRRQRSEEGGVTIEYLQGLHQKHEDWLSYGNVPPIASGFSPGFPAGDYQCRGQSLPDFVGSSQLDLSLHAVKEPRAIQGKVLYLNSSSSPGMPKFINGVPTLVLDYDKEIDMVNDHAAREEYASQVKAYFDFVKALRSKKAEGDLRIAAVTGELAGTNLTQATGEQVLKMQQALQNQGVPGLSAEQLGVVRDNIWNQHWQAQLQSQQQQPILAGCV